MTKAEKASIAYQLVAHGPRVMGGDAVLSDDDSKFWNINYDFVAGYEQAEKDLGWISVKDRLPEEPGWYITCFEDNGVAQGIGISFYVSDTQSWLDDEDIKYEVAIDYWMEIPKLKK